MNPKAIGELSEAKILARLLSKDYIVLLPFGNNQRYDMVADKGDGVFVRGQCKTGRFRNGCIHFNVHSTSGGDNKDYHGQIDVFWVYCPELDGYFEVPIAEVGTSTACLRVYESRIETQAIQWAKNFEV